MVVRCAVEDDVTIRRIRFLVSRRLEVRKSGALRVIVTGGSIQLTACLIKCGAHVNGASGSRGETALMVAAKEGCGDVVKLRGADIDPVDEDGKDAVAWLSGTHPMIF